MRAHRLEFQTDSPSPTHPRTKHRLRYKYYYMPILSHNELPHDSYFIVIFFLLFLETEREIDFLRPTKAITHAISGTSLLLTVFVSSCNSNK